jgi:hypothetical protein
MHDDDRLTSKRWNERVRLFITFVNVTAIGAFGLSVTAPILEAINGTTTVGQMLQAAQASQGGVSIWSVIAWDIALAALVLHVLAHLMVGLIESEE